MSSSADTRKRPSTGSREAKPLDDITVTARRISHGCKFIKQQLFPSKDVDVVAFISVKKQNDDLMHPKVYRLAITMSRGDSKVQLHKIKVKAANRLVLKRSWPLEQLCEIDGASKDPLEQRFSLEFASKRSTGVIQHNKSGKFLWVVDPIEAHKGSHYRSWFLWILLQVCSICLHSVPTTSNLDLLFIEQKARRWFALLLGWVDSEQNAPPSLKNLIRSVQNDSGIDVSLPTSQDLGTELDSEVERLEIPSMTEVEEQEISNFMKQLNLEVGEIHRLEDLLLEELQILDSTNTLALYNSQSDAHTLVEAINELSNDVSSTKTWMTQKDTELKKMRMGIQVIESRNRKLDLLERNYEKLAQTLDLLIKDISLDPEYLDDLMHPDFSKSTGLRTAIKAAEHLRKLLSPQLAQTSGLENLAAVQEQRKELERINKEFSGRASEFMKKMFRDEATDIDESGVHDSGVFVSHENSHSVLRRLQKLMDAMQTLDLVLFKQLRQEYAYTFQPVYTKSIVKVSQKFTSIALAQQPSRKLVHMDNLDAPSISFAPEKSRTLLRSSTKVQKNVSGVKNKVSILNAVLKVLDEIIPVVLDEQEFCSDMFSLDFELQRSSDHTKRASLSESEETSMIKGFDRINGKEITVMLRIIFKGLDRQLCKVIEHCNEMDEIVALGVIELIEKLISKFADQSDFIVELLESVKEKCQSVFEQLVDEQIVWIKDIQVQPKKCGIAQPFLKLPNFINHIENLLQNSRNIVLPGSLALQNDAQHSPSNTTVDSILHKLVDATFAWIEAIAAQDSKYTHVVLALNYHHFWHFFSTRLSRIVSLEKYIAISNELYREHVRSYVKWHLKYAMPEVIQFWESLDSQLKVLSSPSDVASIITRQQLRSLCSQYLSPHEMEKMVKSMFSRTQKHFKSSPLVLKQVWITLREMTGTRYEKFENQIAECYRNEKAPLTRSQVSALFVEGEAGSLFKEVSDSNTEMTEVLIESVRSMSPHVK